MGCTRRDKELMQTFALMQSRKVGANVHTYNSLIRYFCRKHLLPAAEKCFTRMVESGIPPTEKTFLLLLEAYCRLRKYEQAVKFLDHLIDSHESDDIKISIITFTELIKDLRGVRKPARLFQKRFVICAVSLTIEWWN